MGTKMGQKLTPNRAKRFSLGVTLSVSHRKAVSQAFLARFFEKFKKREKRLRNASLQKRSSSGRPEAFASQHDHS